MQASHPWLQHLRPDLMGGITAAIIALPLALAFGVSSGAGAAAGLYGAICCGLFAAMFGGTATQISGPTGPMTVVMAAIFTQFTAKSPDQGVYLAFSVVILAGLMQILLGMIKLGRYITMVPFPVISGFMTGIGTIIIILQLPPLLGATTQSNITEILFTLPALFREMNLTALTAGTLTVITCCFYPRQLTSFIPAPLFVLLSATLLYYFYLPPASLTVVGAIPLGLPPLQWPAFDATLLAEMLTAAAVLALLGAIDSLLTSLVADTMTRTEHNPDQELIGQGLGNIAAGLIGGLPGAGATMRTVANIKAGGCTPLSGIFHSLFLLVLLLGAAPLAENIPLAVLAGLLLKVGLDIIDWSMLKRLHKLPRVTAGLILGVLLLTIFSDLITAVIAGVFIANMITVKHLSDLQVAEMQIITQDKNSHQRLTSEESALIESAGGQVLVLHFNGPISYAAAKTMYQRIRKAPVHKAIIFDFSDVPSIDITTAITIENLLQDAESMAVQAFIVGSGNAVAACLITPLATDLIAAQSRYSTRKDVICAALTEIHAPSKGKCLSR